MGVSVDAQEGLIAIGLSKSFLGIGIQQFVNTGAGIGLYM